MVRTTLAAAEHDRAGAAQALAAARERHAAAGSAHARLAAEARALAEILAVRDGERWPPMVDALSTWGTGGAGELPIVDALST